MCGQHGECGHCEGGYTTLIARVLLALVFLIVGFEKILNFTGTAAVIGSTGIAFPEAVTALAIIMEFGGAVLLILGFYTRIAAWVLIAFTALATILYHRDTSQAIQLMMALKNISIIGGLLLIAEYGAGRFSLGYLLKRKDQFNEKGAAPEER